jgi:nucleoid-associated protein YgaU
MSIGADISVGGAINAAAGIGIGVAAIAGARIPASLRCTDLPNIGFVPFDFNPEKISFKRSSNVGNIPAPPRPGAMPGRSTGARNPTRVVASTISISKVTFTGPLTKLFCDTLLTWMIPNAGLLAMLGVKGFSTQPAKLTFQWGPPMVGFMYQCKITNCTVNYVRFSAIGIPLRAEVDLTMQEVPSVWGSLPTNPTSGGLPGRRSHTVGHGETLQSIATEKYGRPGLWRRIAEVNNINDPGRVRPGTTIYLPNPEELASGAAR